MYTLELLNLLPLCTILVRDLAHTAQELKLYTLASRLCVHAYAYNSSSAEMGSTG